MNWVHLLLALAVIGLASCSQESSPSGAADATAQPGQPVDASQQAPYNIGDVETAIKLFIQLADKSKGQNVEYVELETKRGDLAMAEATFNPPHPAQIWLVSTAQALPSLRPQDAIVVRQRIYVDGREEPIAVQAFVWSGRPTMRERKTLEVDLVHFLQSLTGSVLTHARTEVFWLPDTDPMLIDPAASFDTSKRVEKLSNTMRITFH